MSAIDQIKAATPEEAERLQDEATKKIYKRRLKVKHEAERELHAEEHPPKPVPIARSLQQRLAQQRSPTPWRIAKWQKEGHRALLAAQFKVGKTTFVINLVLSLLDGLPFLGAFGLKPVPCVGLLDFEMAEEEPGQLDDWYEEAGLKHKDRLKVFPMRGRASAFNIVDPNVRAEWADRLKGVKYLILDCTRPVMDALGLDENHDAGRFFTAFDELMREADIHEACVVQHMGHTNERARGDSRFLDWPDVIWTLVRESDDPASKRFVKAFGRGVDVPETALTFNARNHRLTLGTGSRADTKAMAVISAIVAFVQGEANPPNASAIRKAVHESEGASDSVIRKGLKLAVKRGNLIESPGPKNQTLYTVAVQAPPEF